MRRGSALLMVAGFLCALVSPPASTAARERPRQPAVALGAVNVISGDRIAGMRVHVPRDADVSEEAFNNSNLSYSGKGRVVGVVLVQDGPPLRRAYQFVSTRWDFCGSPGCSGEWQISLTHGINWHGRHGYRIPAGDYRLYLIADGAPVRIELRLDGLTGSTDLRPDVGVPGRIASPDSMVPSPASQVFLGSAQSMNMPTYGLLIDADEHEHGPGAGASGSCYWRAKEDDGPERSVPGPHCLTFAERGGIGAGFSTLGGGSASWGTGNVGPGKWRSSYWSAYASPNVTSQFVALWLAYEDPISSR
jgi:hypothetical protein